MERSRIISRSRRWAGAAVAVAVAGMVVGGCTIEATANDTEFDTTHPAVPFNVTVDVPFDLGEGGNALRVTVMSISPFDQTPEHFPRLRVAMRSENDSDRTLDNPDVQLHCDESSIGGEWYGGSTWEIQAGLRSGESREGEVYVGFPAKAEDSQYSVASCSNAYLSITGIRWNDRQTYEARIVVPPEVIDGAVDAPVGEHLPRPRPQS